MPTPKDLLFFDIETGGFSAQESSIASISWGGQRGKITSAIVRGPVAGTTVSTWAQKFVWDPLAGRKKRVSEKRALTAFTQQLEAHRGGTVAGWNIGYQVGSQATGARGFDIPFLLSRAEKYGMGARMTRAFGGVGIRDIGQEYAWAISREVSQGRYKGVVDPKLQAQARGYVKAGERYRGQPRPVWEELARRGKWVRGWKQEQVFEALGLGKYGAHVSSEDIRALRQIAALGDPRIAVAAAAGFVPQWNISTLTQRLIGQAKRGAPKGVDPATWYASLQERARGVLGVEGSWEKQLAEEMDILGGDLSRIRKGLGYTDTVRKAGGFEKLLSAAVPSSLYGKILLGTGIGLSAAFLTKPLNAFSGKDDEWNVIEGLPERGLSSDLRKVHTDFGSGYRGLKIGTAAFAAGAAGAGLLNILQREEYGPFVEDLRELGVSSDGYAFQGYRKSMSYEEKVKSRFKFFKKSLEDVGVKSGTAHKRILIPKKALSEEQLEDVLGFVPVSIAIPEAGETEVRSFRHPHNLYHIHEHGDAWSIHKDRHAAMTMMILARQMREKQAGQSRGGFLSDLGDKAEIFFAGLPHVVTEGIPGLGYYTWGQMTGTQGMRERLSQELPKEYLSIISRMKPIERPGLIGQIFSGKDDDYNTIEGLRHGGMAGDLRKILTDFGSGWVRRLISAGMPQEQIAKKVAGKWGKEVITTGAGEMFMLHKAIGKGGFGEAIYAQSLRSGQGAIYKRALAGTDFGTYVAPKTTALEKFKDFLGFGKEKTSPMFGPRSFVTLMHRVSAGSGSGMVARYTRAAGVLRPMTERVQKTFGAGKFRNPMHYEAAMQTAAAKEMPDIVPKVYGTTETGFVQEFAGRGIKGPKELTEAAEWIKTAYKPMVEGKASMMHFDPDVSNIVRTKTGQFRLIDWGVSAPSSKALRTPEALGGFDELVNTAAEKAHQKARDKLAEIASKNAAAVRQAAQSARPVDPLIGAGPKTQPAVPRAIQQEAKWDMADIQAAMKKSQQADLHNQASASLTVNGRIGGKGHRRQRNK